MIVGNGDIATFLKERNLDNKKITFFAAGVSNSNCQNPIEFEREWRTLKENTFERHLVYFSSLCIYYSNSLYAKHKREMELKIKRNFLNYTIVRLGNISWGKNPNTFINFIKNKLESGEDFEIRDVYRHIVSEQEFEYWMKLIPIGTRNEMNIPGRMVWVPDFVKEIVNDNSRP